MQLFNATTDARYILTVKIADFFFCVFSTETHYMRYVRVHVKMKATADRLPHERGTCNRMDVPGSFNPSDVINPLFAPSGNLPKNH